MTSHKDSDLIYVTNGRDVQQCAFKRWDDSLKAEGYQVMSDAQVADFKRKNAEKVTVTAADVASVEMPGKATAEGEGTVS